MKLEKQHIPIETVEDPEPSRTSVSRAALRAAVDDAPRVDLAWLRLPRAGDAWTLGLDDLRFLVSLVRRLRPTQILEFGSGLSTHVLARCCAEAGLTCRITSVDHDPEFSRSAAEELARVGLNETVRFVVAPLVARDCGGKTLPVYLLDPSQFAGVAPVDVILVDGPPELLGGREGALYQALDYARVGTVIVLDDADRGSEQVALARLQENLGAAVEVQVLPAPYQSLAAIIVHQPVPRAQLGEHRRRLSASEVEQIVPTGQPFILVDQGQWGETFVPGRWAIPFTERDGRYSGPPVDDVAAIAELQRLRQVGASHLVVLWPAFWWLEYYREFHQYLQTHGRLVLTNDRLRVFNLT